jgi:hypothetical protein
VLGLYLFAAVLGVGLLAFSMGDDGDSGHGHDVSLGHGHAGDILLGFFRPRNLIFFAAAFGVTGSLLTWSGAGRPLTAALAFVMGLGAMITTHFAFRYLRKTESGANVIGDHLIEGTVARVTVPVSPEARGRIAANIGGREVHIVARLAPGASGAVDAGKEALVVRMVDGEAEISPYGGTE